MLLPSPSAFSSTLTSAVAASLREGDDVGEPSVQIPVDHEKMLSMIHLLIPFNSDLKLCLRSGGPHTCSGNVPLSFFRARQYQE